MRHRPHFVIGFVVMAAILIGNTWLAFVHTKALEDRAERRREVQSIVREAHGLVSEITTVSSNQMGYAYGSLVAPTVNDEVSRAHASATDRIKRLREHAVEDPRRRDAIEDLATHANDALDSAEQLAQSLAGDAAAGRRGGGGPEQPPGLGRSARRVDAARDGRAKSSRGAGRGLPVVASDAPPGASRSSRSSALTALICGYVILAWSRRRDEQNLREQTRLAAQNRLLIESTAEGICGIDGEGRVTFLNQAAEGLLGVPDDDAIGRSLHDFLEHDRCGETGDGDECAIRAALRLGLGQQVDQDVIYREGRAIPVVYSASPVIKHGRADGAVVVLTDVTDRLQADRRAREAAERFQNLADNVAQIIWIADPTGEIHWLNGRWDEYAGRPDGAEMDAWRQSLHPDEAADVQASMRDHVHGGVAWDTTIRLRGADDGYRWFLTRAVPIRSDDQAILRWVGTHTDVTEQRESARALEKSRQSLRLAKKEAETANRAKSRFLASMSHELRTPLNAVIMYSELLKEEASDRGLDSFTDDLDKIRNAGRHLLTLVNGVLDLSKIEAGKMDVHLSTFAIREMVEDVAATVEPLVRARDAALELDIGEGVGEMTSDVTKVRQILLNLLSNAVRFCDGKPVTLRVSSANGWVEMEVEDHGPGIAEEDRAKLFRPFEQVKGDGGGEQDGTGLGLSITHRFCELLGGSVDVESELGVGSTFRVRLPSKIVDGDSTETSTTEVGVETAEQVVLVIDDDPAARDLLSRTLRSDGLGVVTAADGRAGIEMARRHHPSIILLDVIMPEMDGWAVLGALKQDPTTAGIPVIMLSMLSNAEMGSVLGADEYITKPVDQAQLLALVDRYRRTDDAPHVLVVDDDPGAREIVRRALQEQGVRLSEAANGREGLDAILSSVPDLVLLDLMMPESDGFEFLESLREDPELVGVPVAVLTSRDLTTEERRWLNQRVETIIEKGRHPGRGSQLDALRSAVVRIITKSHRES